MRIRKKRDNITFWLCDDLEDIWLSTENLRGTGKAQMYSKKAIEICLT